jgi:hypothetical protein
LEEGESGEDLDGGGGGRGEGVGARCGPSGGRGGTGVDPTTVGEAVDTASRRTRRSEHVVWPRRRSGRQSARHQRWT